MKRLRILSLAMQDLENGKHFYDLQQEGVGEYFLDSLFSDIDALLLYAGTHSQHHDYYRCLAKRFPFAIYYHLYADEIQVWRVLDCRNKPSRIRQALKRP